MKEVKTSSCKITTRTVLTHFRLIEIQQTSVEFSTNFQDITGAKPLPKTVSGMQWQNSSTFKDFPGCKGRQRRPRLWSVPFGRFLGQRRLQRLQLLRQLFALLSWRQMPKVLACLFHLQVTMTLSTQLTPTPSHIDSDK